MWHSSISAFTVILSIFPRRTILVNVSAMMPFISTGTGRTPLLFSHRQPHLPGTPVKGRPRIARHLSAISPSSRSSFHYSRDFGGTQRAIGFLPCGFAAADAKAGSPAVRRRSMRSMGVHPSMIFIKEKSPTNMVEDDGGAYWTRTSDPRDVNTVLYQLSQSTKDLCEPISAFLSMSHSWNAPHRVWRYASKCRCIFRKHNLLYTVPGGLSIPWVKKFSFLLPRRGHFSEL